MDKNQEEKNAEKERRWRLEKKRIKKLITSVVEWRISTKGEKSK